MLTARGWVLLGLALAGLGFAVFMLTGPKLEASRTLLGQLAIAVDPQAASEVARLRQQYYAGLAVMVAGLGVAAYGLRTGNRRSR